MGLTEQLQEHKEKLLPQKNAIYICTEVSCQQMLQGGSYSISPPGQKEEVVDTNTKGLQSPLPYFTWLLPWNLPVLSDTAWGILFIYYPKLNFVSLKIEYSLYTELYSILPWIKFRLLSCLGGEVVHLAGFSAGWLFFVGARGCEGRCLITSCYRSNKVRAWAWSSSKTVAEHTEHDSEDSKLVRLYTTW